MGKRNKERIARIAAGQEQPIVRQKQATTWLKGRGSTEIMDKGDVMLLRRDTKLHKPSALDIARLG